MSANIMLGNQRQICDTSCEIYPEIENLVDEAFWDFEQYRPKPNDIVVLARQTVNRHADQVKQLTEICLPVLANPSEGSITLKLQCQRLGLLDLVRSRKLLLVGCGHMEPELNCMVYDHYAYRATCYESNTEQCARIDEIYTKLHKPYQFLFLNGRTRPHRKYMIELMRNAGLLEHALWTNLDTTPVYHHTYRTDLLLRPSEIQLLPAEYEVEQFQVGQKNQYQNAFVKHELFDNHWGDVYIRAEPYIDTYFSLVSETVFDYPYSLRSEKIYKPIAIGHPFVAVANRGFYQDLHRAGFQTFSHVIDESFDLIDNNQDRLDRIAQVVQDLCENNLEEFLVASRAVTKYNQQHLAAEGVRIFREFPDRFVNFIQSNL
jgi:hypothetical protein